MNLSTRNKVFVAVLLLISTIFIVWYFKYNSSPSWSFPDDDDSIDESTKKALKIDMQPLLNKEQQQALSAEDPDGLLIKKLTSDESSTLKQVLILHRHGDRTGIEFSKIDPLASVQFWKWHGVGRLTHTGKARLYLIGRLLRLRYSTFINSYEARRHSLTRSAGVHRCIESAEMLNAGFMSLLHERDSASTRLVRWSPNEFKYLSSIYQPIAVLTNDWNIDGMLSGYSNCTNLIYKYKPPSLEKYLKDYEDVGKLIKSEYGLNESNYMSYYEAQGFVEPELKYFNDRVPQKVKDMLPRILEAGFNSFVLFSETVEAKRWVSGLLINDMIKNMDLLIQESASATSTKRKMSAEPYSDALSPSSKSMKFLHYSSHDSNVLSLVSVLGSLNALKRSPKYGATVIVELHQQPKEKPKEKPKELPKEQQLPANTTATIVTRLSDNNDSESPNEGYFVKAMYLETAPNANLIELELPGCKRNERNQCSYDEFKEMVDKYRVPNWKRWMKECGSDISDLEDIYNSVK